MARPAGMIGLHSSAATAAATDDPRYTAAEFPTNKLLYLTQLADACGIDCRGWFAGLALSRTQLADPALRVSYRQASGFVRRALAALRAAGVADTGLRIGREGTVGGFGLLGLAMMTSRTFGEAMQAGIAHHKICGCLLDLSFEAVDERTVAMVALPLFARHAWALTALRLGEDKAASFGVNVRYIRLETMLIVALLASIPVSFVGTIGFIGLVGPHIARMILGEDQRFFLPGSVLCGALLLSVTSIVSKSIVPGVVFPIGIITALVGVPFFFSLIISNMRKSW